MDKVEAFILVIADFIERSVKFKAAAVRRLSCAYPPRTRYHLALIRVFFDNKLTPKALVTGKRRRRKKKKLLLCLLILAKGNKRYQVHLLAQKQRTRGRQLIDRM